MSKRKNSDDLKYLKEKLKKLEREIYSSRRKRVRVMRVSSSSDSSPDPPSRQPPACRSEPQDRQTNDDTWNEITRYDESDDFVAELCGEGAPPVQTQVQTIAQVHAPPPRPQPTASAPAPPAQAHARASSPPQPIAPATAQSAAPVHSELLASILPNEVEPNAEATLDEDVLDILGIDPTQTEKFGSEIHKAVAVRFEHYAITGLTKEIRKELTDKYLLPSNCKLINAPALNPEIKAALAEHIVKRDKAIETKQKILAAAISSLGQATTLVLSQNEKQPDLLRLLIDTARMICDCQHNDSQTRRYYVLSAVKQELKEQMKNAKIGGLLFGENLQETLKAAKAINKSGADLKAVYSSTKLKGNTKSTPTTPKNWRNPSRKQTAAPKIKETTVPTPAATRTPRSSSSKKPQRPRYNHR